MARRVAEPVSWYTHTPRPNAVIPDPRFDTIWPNHTIRKVRAARALKKSRMTAFLENYRGELYTRKALCGILHAWVTSGNRRGGRQPPTPCTRPWC